MINNLHLELVNKHFIKVQYKYKPLLYSIKYFMVSISAFRLSTIFCFLYVQSGLQSGILT